MFLTGLLIVSLTCGGESAKILVVFPVPIPSHYILGTALSKGLHKAGHEVTMISPFSEQSSTDSYRNVKLTEILERRAELIKDVDLYEDDTASAFTQLWTLTKIYRDYCELALTNPNVIELLNSGEKFDVVLVEEFLNPSLKLLANQFNASLVVFSTMGANAWTNDFVGNPSPPSYVPDLWSSYSSTMSFSERLYNTIIFIFHRLIFKFYTLPAHSEIAQKYLPNSPDIEEVVYKPSLILLNSHPSTNTPVPHVPNMIDIGGFHVQPSNKTLPEDLQNFLDNAPDGVIYFSMGSTLKSKDLPIEKRKSILNALSQLKQKVLWKFEDENIKGNLANVMIRKWLPQQDVLAHKNIKLFITHGGLLSITETIYHGVPVLAIPVFGDQKLNAQNIVNSGFGLSLPYSDLTEENLIRKVHQLFDNSKYRKTAALRSRIFHDRIVPPMETAVYWIEYVVRNKDMSHLRVAGVDLPWWKYLLLDVVAFVAASASACFVLFYLCIKRVFRRNTSLSPREKLKKM